MAEYLPNLLKARTRSEHPRCSAVPQPVRMNLAEPRTTRGRHHDLSHAAGRQPVMRRAHSHEQTPVLRRHRTTRLQVSDDRLADINRERQPFRAPALPDDHQLPRAPINVLQRERRNLAGSHAEPREHRQDREVAPAAARLTVTGRKQSIHLLGLQRSWQSGQSPRRRRRDRTDQRLADHPSQVQEPQQRPQRGDRQLRRASRLNRAPSDNKPDHISDRHTTQIQLAGAGIATLQERTDRGDVPLDRVGRQPALDRQILPIVREQHLDRTDRGRT